MKVFHIFMVERTGKGEEGWTGKGEGKGEGGERKRREKDRIVEENAGSCCPKWDQWCLLLVSVYKEI